MKLFPPADDIDLYKEGFTSGKDLLNREETGKQLSVLVEKIDDPMVIALDGSWGSGKSFFLKCWVGAHKLENYGTATTVYFDAFEHDYLDDPLVALAGVIGDRFKDDAETTKTWAKAKTAAAKLWRPGLRMGLAISTAGASEIAGPIVGAGLAAANNDLQKASEDFWRKEDGKRRAMADFRSSLRNISSLKTEGVLPKKLVVVIDELDRCRPDYALSLLEVIKHFFTESHVSFILGINLEEFQNTVRSRYGPQINSRKYLQKFITLEMELPNEVEGEYYTRIPKKYYQNLANEMGIRPVVINETSAYLDLPKMQERLNLRDIQKILSHTVLSLSLQSSVDNLQPGHRIFIIGLVILKNTEIDLYKLIQSNEISFQLISDFFGFDAISDSEDNYTLYVIKLAWEVFLEHTSDKNSREYHHLFTFPLRNPRKKIKNLIKNHMNTYNLPETSLSN